MTTPSLRHYTRSELAVIANQIVGERLPGRPAQGIYEEVAVPRYKVGARMVVEGGWTLHYCQIVETTGFHTMRLAGNGNVIEAANEYFTNPVAAPAGQNRITITDNASPLNYYENGLVECWHGGIVEQHRIKSSTATNGATITITLYDNLLTGLDIADGGAISPSIYRNVGRMAGTPLSAHQAYVTAVGLPLLSYTNAYYAWIVTWGPIAVSMQGGSEPCSADDMADVYCHTDGTCAVGTFFNISGGIESPQRVGYGLPAGAYAHSQIMLQLDP